MRMPRYFLKSTGERMVKGTRVCLAKDRLRAARVRRLVSMPRIGVMVSVNDMRGESLML